MRTYVMQVATGRELKTLDLIGRVLGPDAAAVFFVPRFQYPKKARGEWRLVDDLLTPGYVFARASAAGIEEMAGRLRRVPAFTRLLAQDGRIIPLQPEEVEWICRLTGEDHVVEPSCGFVEGDQVIITQGPLVGLETIIKKIDRHKRLAYVEVQLLGRSKLIKVGVEVVRKHGGVQG